MHLRYSEHFLRAYHDAPAHIQKAFHKQARLLLANLRHPSLRAKKYDEARDIWQARVTRQRRLLSLTTPAMARVFVVALGCAKEYRALALRRLVSLWSVRMRNES